MTTIGNSPESAIVYTDDTDIYMFLERTFGKPSKTDFYGVEPDSYFILTEQTLKEAKTDLIYRIIYVEDKDGNRHKVFFKKA